MTVIITRLTVSPRRSAIARTWRNPPRTVRHGPAGGIKRRTDGLYSEAYLATVLDRMARDHLNTWLEELLPWNFQPPVAKAA